MKFPRILTLIHGQYEVATLSLTEVAHCPRKGERMTIDGEHYIVSDVDHQVKDAELEGIRIELSKVD